MGHALKVLGVPHLTEDVTAVVFYEAWRRRANVRMVMIRYCPGSVPPQGPLADSLGPINASGLFSRTAAPDV
jgi:hypothetical protein